MTGFLLVAALVIAALAGMAVLTYGYRERRRVDARLARRMAEQARRRDRSEPDGV